MQGPTRKHLATLVLAAAVLVTPAAAEAATVGEFIQELARVKALASTDPQVAADALSASGVRFPEGLDLDATLTEGDVVRISNATGLKVTATDSAASFDAGRVDEYFAVFSNQLAESGSGITVRGPGTCALDELGICSQPGADCQKNGKPGFCQPTTDGCTCNTGKAKGKRKQVVTAGEPE